MTQALAWGAIIEGEQIDLDYWSRALQEPRDPWIVMAGSTPVLRSSSLDHLSTADEVRDQCIAHIDRLNGAIALAHADAKQVRFSSVVQFAPNGVLHRWISPPAAGSFEWRSGEAFFSPTVIQFGPDGKAIPVPPAHTMVHAWAEQAEQDDLLDDALIYFGRPLDWFDIYKALECIEERFGGETRFRALGWRPAKELRLQKQTANAARHARKVVRSPENPMGIKEAHALLGILLRRAFDEAPKYPAPVKSVK